MRVLTWRSPRDAIVRVIFERAASFLEARTKTGCCVMKCSASVNMIISVPSACEQQLDAIVVACVYYCCFGLSGGVKNDKIERTVVVGATS